jgi:hypothetical protein
MEIDIRFLGEDERDQCSHVIDDGSFFIENRRRCLRTSLYEVEGAKLCKIHAGEWCLNYCIHEAKENQ